MRTALDDHVAVECGQRQRLRRRGDAAIVRKTRERLRDGDEDVLPIADGVHLVDGQHEMRNAEQVGERRVALRLRDNALARVDKQDGELRGACRRDHVARVLLVPWRVGDDELARGVAK